MERAVLNNKPWMEVRMPHRSQKRTKAMISCTIAAASQLGINPC